MSGCVSGPAIYRHAFVGEAVFAYQGESPCKLTTDGLRSCIGFGGYDQDLKIGFLAYFYIGKHAEIFFANFEDILKSMAPQAEKFSFFCKRTGGLSFATQSKSIVEIIRAFVKSTWFKKHLLKKICLKKFMRQYCSS